MAETTARDQAVRDILQEYNGQMVTEGQLSKRFSIGRSTVREALGELRMFGYVTTAKGSGTFIKPVTRIRAVQTIETRKILEPQVAFVLCSIPTDHWIGPVQTAHDKLTELTKSKKFKSRISKDHAEKVHVADLDWHVAIATAANNLVAAEFVERAFKEMAMLSQGSLHDSTSLDELRLEHQRILKALKNSSSTLETVKRVFHAHLDSSLKRWKLIA